MKRPIATFALLVLSLIGLEASAQISVRSGGAPLEPGIGVQQRDQITWTNPRFGDTLFPVNVNNYWGHMNQRGQLVVFPDFDWTDDFYDGLARAVVQGKTGFITGNGSWALEPIYPYADRFQDGRAIVGDGTHFGFIEKSGRILLPPQLDAALRFRENMAAVMKDGRCGYLNVKGELEIPARFTSARSFHEGYAAVTWSDSEAGPIHTGYIDRRGKAAFSDNSGDIQELGDFNDGLARIKGAPGWGYLGKNFKLRIKPRFQDARDFTNGVAAVKLDDKWGFIDKTGRFIIPLTYDAADDMDDKLMMVTLNNKIGFINRVGTVSIEPQFDRAQPFYADYARVGVGPTFGYISISGRSVWDPRQATLGFINKRTKEGAVIRGHENVIHNRTVDAPQYRDPVPVLYEPEYLYDEVLPPRKP